MSPFRLFEKCRFQLLGTASRRHLDFTRRVLSLKCSSFFPRCVLFSYPPTFPSILTRTNLFQNSCLWYFISSSDSTYDSYIGILQWIQRNPRFCPLTCEFKNTSLETFFRNTATTASSIFSTNYLVCCP